MGGLDAVLGGLLAVGVWRGLRTGALLQIVGTVGWLLGFVVATALMEPVGLLVAESLGVSERTGPVLGFVVLFGGVVAALTAAAHAVRKTLEAVRLGGVDRMAGGAVGGLRAAFGLSVMLMATAFSPVPGGGPLLIGEASREASVLYEPVEAIAPEVWGMARDVTPGLQSALADKFNAWQAGEGGPATDEDPLE